MMTRGVQVLVLILTLQFVKFYSEMHRKFSRLNQTLADCVAATVWICRGGLTAFLKHTVTFRGPATTGHFKAATLTRRRWYYLQEVATFLALNIAEQVTKSSQSCHLSLCTQSVRLIIDVFGLSSPQFCPFSLISFSFCLFGVVFC